MEFRRKRLEGSYGFRVSIARHGQCSLPPTAIPAASGCAPKAIVAYGQPSRWLVYPMRNGAVDMKIPMPILTIGRISEVGGVDLSLRVQ